MKKKLISLMLAVISLFGCTSIPENGSMLNQKVSEGIARNQIEVEKIIKALADVERAILDEEWGTIYEKIETEYVTKHRIQPPLTPEQRRAIAANAAKTYYGLLKQISSIEHTLVSQTRANSEALIAMNDEVSKYLLSVESLDAARKNVESQLKAIVGIDMSSISGLANTLVGGI